MLHHTPHNTNLQEADSLLSALRETPPAPGVQELHSCPYSHRPRTLIRAPQLMLVCIWILSGFLGCGGVGGGGGGRCCTSKGEERVLYPGLRGAELTAERTTKGDWTDSVISASVDTSPAHRIAKRWVFCPIRHPVPPRGQTGVGGSQPATNFPWPSQLLLAVSCTTHSQPRTAFLRIICG